MEDKRKRIVIIREIVTKMNNDPIDKVKEYVESQISGYAYPMKMTDYLDIIFNILHSYMSLHDVTPTEKYIIMHIRAVCLNRHIDMSIYRSFIDEVLTSESSKITIDAIDAVYRYYRWNGAGFDNLTNIQEYIYDMMKILFDVVLLVEFDMDALGRKDRLGFMSRCSQSYTNITPIEIGRTSTPNNDSDNTHNIKAWLTVTDSKKDIIFNIYDILSLKFISDTQEGILKDNIDILRRHPSLDITEMEDIRNIHLLVRERETYTMMEYTLQIIIEMLEKMSSYQLNYLLHPLITDVEETIDVDDSIVKRWNETFYSIINGHTVDMETIKEMLDSGEIREDLLDQAIDIAADICSDDLLELLCEYQN